MQHQIEAHAGCDVTGLPDGCAPRIATCSRTRSSFMNESCDGPGHIPWASGSSLAPLGVRLVFLQVQSPRSIQIITHLPASSTPLDSRPATLLFLSWPWLTNSAGFERGAARGVAGQPSVKLAIRVRRHPWTKRCPPRAPGRRHRRPRSHHPAFMPPASQKNPSLHHQSNLRHTPWSSGSSLTPFRHAAGLPPSSVAPRTSVHHPSAGV